MNRPASRRRPGRSGSASRSFSSGDAGVSFMKQMLHIAILDATIDLTTPNGSTGAALFEVEHDLFRKPLHTFRDHARGEADMDTSMGRVSPPRQRMQLSWTDPRFRGLVWQVVVVGLVAGIIVWLWRNTVHNLDTRHISTGFGFLSREAGMPIADALIPYRPSDTYLRALLVGVLNTLRVAVIGVILATILGTLIGIARLSKNWLLAKLAAIYVETLRDLPLLLQLLAWYVVLQGLPPGRQALHPVAGVYLSNRGLILPTIAWVPEHAFVLFAFAIGTVATWMYRRLALARQMRDGQPRRVWPVALLLIVGLPAC